MKKKVIVVDVKKIKSAVLKRLIEEVTRRDNYTSPHSFDRVHNRHNRS